MKHHRGLMARLVVATAILVASVSQLAQPAAAFVTGPGYVLLRDSGLIPSGYTFLLVNTPGVEDIRGYVQSAASSFTSITGIPTSVPAGTITDRTPARGEILIRRDFEYCSNEEATPACATSYYDYNGPKLDVEYVASARIWVGLLPAGTDPQAVNQRQKIITHEVGHALGLWHYSDLYNGTYQVMKQGWNEVFEFQQGDKNGLNYQRDKGYAPPPPADPRRMGIVDSGNVCRVAEGPYGSGWATMATNCVKIALDTDRIAIRQTEGLLDYSCSVKEGGLGATWSKIVPSGCADIALDGDRISVLKSDGWCYTKEGGLGAVFAGSFSGCGGIDVTGEYDRIGARRAADNLCYVKEGPLNAGWANVADRCQNIAVYNLRTAIRQSEGSLGLDSSCSAREGALGSSWSKIVPSGCSQIALADDRISIRKSDGYCYTKDGGIGAVFGATRGPNCDRIAVDSGRIATKDNDGYCYLKEGALNAQWVTLWGPGCVDVALSDGTT